jgi:hypothetical protein
VNADQFPLPPERRPALRAVSRPRARIGRLSRLPPTLAAHGRLGDLAFMSFENYPLGCKKAWTHLLEAPAVTRELLDTWRGDGLTTPSTVVWVVPNCRGALYEAPSPSPS